MKNGKITSCKLIMLSNTQVKTPEPFKLSKQTITGTATMRVNM